ncbi:NACHT domain-containing NTPase [Pseudomonas sp. URMO17WK12:I12]|jgi:hypothetical protein|uniref:NACHT domain-containing protein n=1 Tax=Pseudomonas sp. URMO17WK12:I12 TaxID=1259797 RepID=UPI0004B41E21|nr:hypothetical protein [Pseudomonas sp. URMO17WK12:I12]
MPPVPLTRHFRLIPDAYQKDDLPLGELWLGSSHGENQTWKVLFTEYRVVILAEAGAGKTYELQWAANLLQNQGKAAFFIRIEDISDRFETAFEIGTAEAFSAWLSGTDEAWFFLDSVDELRLTEARAFEQALRYFADQVGPASQRAHVYVSSRPYAWRPQLDRALLEELLPFAPQTTSLETDGIDDPAEDTEVAAEHYTTQTADDPLSALRLYQLTPLSINDIEIFAQHSGVLDPTVFLEELERGNLLTLAGLPFDLRDLIGTWNAEHALANRLTILQQSIARQLDQAARDLPTLTRSRLEEGAELLAIGVVLTGISSLRIQESGSEAAIKPDTLLQEWSCAELNALLMCGIFGEPVYGEVRFRHREIRELLAARWISNHLGVEANRSEIESWIFRRQYEQTVLSARMRPLLPWLILLDESIRNRVIRDYPDVVLEGGDAAVLPFAARGETLTRVIEQITDANSSIRGLDNDAIIRIAGLDLEALTLELIGKHAKHDDAIFILGRLAWQGKMLRCVEPLANIAVESGRGLYARIVSVRAVAALSDTQRFLQLWQDILACEGSVPRGVFSELVSYAPSQQESSEFILQTLNRSGKHDGYDASGLTSSLADFVKRLALSGKSNALELLHGFAEGLLGLLKKTPHIERGDCAVSKEYQWLMPTALLCVEHLIAVRAPAALSSTSLALLSAVPALLHWQGAELQEARKTFDMLVPQWTELNDALFWWTVAECRKKTKRTGQPLRDDWPVTWPGHFWSFDEASFPRTLAWINQRAQEDDRYVALARAYRTYRENSQPQCWLDQLLVATHDHTGLKATLQAWLNPPPDPATLSLQAQERKHQQLYARRKKKRSKDWDAFVARVKDNPKIVRHPPGLKTNELSQIQYHLMEHIRAGNGLYKRSEGANWSALIPEFGNEVAGAYRDAAIAFWRAYQPDTRSEGAAPNSIPVAVMFGLAGLEIELESESAIAHLTNAEAEAALRYALWEINGFPQWFEPLCRLYPLAVTNVLHPEIQWELQSSLPEQNSYYVLHNLVYYAPGLHGALAPAIYEWISKHQVVNHDCLNYCRLIMTAGDISATRIAGLAAAKVSDPSTPPQLLPVWHAVRVHADPYLALPPLKHTFRSLSATKAERFGEVFSVALLGGRRETVKGNGRFQTPSILKDLYLLVHRVVRARDDLNRANTGVYSPTLRDDAQDARERLFGLLSELPKEATYRTILELAVAHPDPRFRAFMRASALQRATVDGDLALWSEDEVANVARRLTVINAVDTSSPETPCAVL